MSAQPQFLTNAEDKQMTVHIKHFDREKALEVIVFIAQKLKSFATHHSISKMLYLSDKRHLQEYGRLICGDRYIAMSYGPVPSAIYDIRCFMKSGFTEGYIRLLLPEPRLIVSSLLKYSSL